jgi:hypothetical protein
MLRIELQNDRIELFQILDHLPQPGMRSFDLASEFGPTLDQPLQNVIGHAAPRC